MLNFNELTADGLNAPLTTVASPTSFNPKRELGASRYRYTHDDRHLDALLINKGADTLVVSFHGAVSRSETALPKFERLTSINSLEVSSMYFGDPGLWSDASLELAWFTGWRGFNAQYVIAQWIIKSASEIGASKIVLSGTSGGGFAALQISALIPHSVAVVYSPHVAVEEYLVNGTSYAAQSNYLKSLWPDIYETFKNNKGIHEKNWSAAFDDRFSCLTRYSSKTQNRILLVQNDEDINGMNHFHKIKQILQNTKDKVAFHSLMYSAGDSHNPPAFEMYLLGLEHALNWSRTSKHYASLQESARRQMGWHERMSRRMWGQERGVPWAFENKLYLDEFCTKHDYPKPRIYSTVDSVDELSQITNYENVVIKPTNLSSSIGVMILEKRDTKSYFDRMTNRTYTLNEILEHQRLLAEKWSIESYVIEQRVHDIGKYPIPRDFKFYAFKGHVALIQCIDRNEIPSRNAWFNGNFDLINDGSIGHNAKYVEMASFAKPRMWRELLQLARAVSENLETGFARIDLFSTPHGPLLGEVTLTPGGPYFRQHFTFSNELDSILGSLWEEADSIIGKFSPGSPDNITSNNEKNGQ